MPPLVGRETRPLEWRSLSLAKDTEQVHGDYRDNRHTSQPENDVTHFRVLSFKLRRSIQGILPNRDAGLPNPNRAGTLSSRWRPPR